MAGVRNQAIEAVSPGTRNEVLLVGKLSGEPSVRTLPSGDQLTTWRLVVARQPKVGRRPDGSRQPTVDTIDCSTQKRIVQRSVARWVPGDVVEVRGALRRRFWRGPHGPASRCEVDVVEVRRVAVAAG